MKIIDVLTEAKDHVKLPRGEKVILQAEGSDYKRGLIITLKKKGGYDIEYWYETPDNIMPAEVKVDGKSVSKDGKKVFFGFHPKKGDKK